MKISKPVRPCFWIKRGIVVPLSLILLIDFLFSIVSNSFLKSIVTGIDSKNLLESNPSMPISSKGG